MVNLEHLRVTIDAIFWWYITVVCKHIMNKAGLRIIKTLIFFSGRRSHLRPMVPLKSFLFAMNRMCYNKKGFDLDNHTQFYMNLFLQIYTDPEVYNHATVIFTLTFYTLCTLVYNLLIKLYQVSKYA